MSRTLISNSKEAKELGSFKDPDGYVFYANDSVYRHIKEDRRDFYTDLLKRPVVQKLINESKLIETKTAELDGNFVLEHKKIDFINYPYEWSCSQLIDAAIFTLEIQSELLDQDLCLKDATPYNVQFVNSRPIFIDFTSIESNEGRNLWLAYNQFLECFFYTIVLKLERNISTKTTLITHLDGIKVSEIQASIGGLKAFTKYLMELGLPYLFRDQDKTAKEALNKTEKKYSETEINVNIKSQKFTLSLLINKLKSFKKRHLKNLEKETSTWSDYTDSIHYGEGNYQSKKDIIREIIKEAEVKRLLDLGCNQGDFSILAENFGAEVVSADFDHNCIDKLYQKASSSNLKINPVWFDLANPSPSLGWQNKERASILERLRTGFKADIVFALALMHHLLISSRVPLEEIISFLASLTKKHLVIEFVGPKDGMFIKTLGTRTNLYEHITEEYFENALSKYFSIVKRYDEANGRKIYFLKLIDA